MVGLGILEILALLLGFDLMGDTDADADFDLDADGEGLLGWLGFGAVPVLISAILFLTAFGVVGLAVRMAVPVNTWIAAVPAVVAGFATTKFAGGAIGRLLQRNETTAIASDRLVGGVATIVLGETRKGHPTQAKLKDEHGQTHYVLVEALRDVDAFDKGDTVLLVERQGPKFFVVEAGPDALDHLDARVSPQELSAEHRPKAH
jgi:hypothetical protein